MTVGYVFSIIFLFVPGIISQISGLPEYDFEGDAIPSEISTARESSLSLSNSRFKNGEKSLEWQWTAAQHLTWDLSSRTVEVTKDGGIKIWIYNSNKLPKECLTVCVREESSKEVSCFPMHLNFTGWRAAWVGYKEFIGCPPKVYGCPSAGTSVRRSIENSFRSGNQIDQFFLTAPSSATAVNPLYIDLLRFAQTISKATRDFIVPPLTYDKATKCIRCAYVATVTEEDALSLFQRKEYWQQLYRWSIITVPELATQVDSGKLDSIREINQRLVNWYANESITFIKIPHRVSPSDLFLIQRWDGLLKNFDSARGEFDTFTVTAGNPLSSGLFARTSELGDSDVNGGAKKFSELFYKVLHPLALEYHIRSRPIEVNHATCLFATKYTCTPALNIPDVDIEAITGKDSTAKSNFRTEYNLPLTSDSSVPHSTCVGVTKVCFDHVMQAVANLNNNRKEKIFELFAYIKDQGWGIGSALGSMDHELLGMSGFAHSVFLMKNELKTAGQLHDIIAVMKWYMEFGEVYQTEFEFKGSSADRIRTVMLFRLMTVMIMPEDDDVQQREKIRDMEALKGWIENALSISEGLSDLIKPDFTSYHNSLFNADEIPSALHTAALVSYLLDETRYQLHSNTKLALINVFKVFRTVAVRYSTPSQIGGLNPKYDQAIFAEHVPAFAYLATKSPFVDFTAVNIPNLNKAKAEVRMFLRLYEPTTGSDRCVGKLNEHLCNGNISQNYYFNTLGAVEIMERVKTLASSVISGPQQWFYRAEESRTGHWSKQFASLSIHRRGNWAVTVKGFDKSVVDFESSLNPAGNLYGMYSSHGAMLIANSESALSSKDVDRGWDWRKIPGTTAINVPFSEMLIKSNRHYNPSCNVLAGGVSFKGSKPDAERNGVFGMDFVQPTYDVPSSSLFSKENLQFSFKKSVFFYDDLIVSLGSSIIYDNYGKSHELHTTLFQDMMPESTSPKDPETDVFRCNDGGTLHQTAWEDKALVTLVDVNGNRYYIPQPDTQGLVFARNEMQESRKGDISPPETTNGMYCTAWFNHGSGLINPSSPKNIYEFAVQVDAEPVDGGEIKPALVPGDRYSIINQNTHAHAVKFPAHGTRGTVHGYVVFSKDPPDVITFDTPSPIASILHPSVIMTEETTDPEKLYIGVNSATLNLQERPGSPSWCKGGTTSPKTSDDADETLLFCSKSTGQAVHVNLRENTRWLTLNSLFVGGSSKVTNQDRYLVPLDHPRDNPLQFTNLRNGATTEVEFSAV